jgi:hypothetical protein
MSKFLQKKEALSYFSKNNNDSDKRLFAEDINILGSKQYYVANPSKIFSQLRKNNTTHYYEFWSDKCQIKFSLDIDIKFTETEAKTMTADYVKGRITNIINNVIAGAKLYYNHTYDISKIMVLKNDDIEQQKENPNKISYHIVFNGLTFDNYLICKDFFLRLCKDYDMSWCDKAIYNLTCLRLCFSTKMGKQAMLMPIKFIINGTSTKNLEFNSSENVVKEYWLSSLITNINPSDRVIDKSLTKTPASQLRPKYDTDNKQDITNINLEKILFELPDEYYTNYEYWTKIGMILASLENGSGSNNDSESDSESNDGNSTYYDLWYRWSEQYDGFKPREMPGKWRSFLKDKSSRLTVGTLIKWARDAGIVDIYKNAKATPDRAVTNYPMTDIVISDKYRSKALTLNQAKLTPSIYVPFLNAKFLAVQSEKGTGKTSNMLDALFDPNNNMINDRTSILFVSSRRTFGIKLMSDLKKHKFRLYSEIADQGIVARRIICQVDSLLRLERDKYDYVIIDECESLARYLTSSHFTKNPKASTIISYLDLRAKEADHLYIMDADLSDRCLNYFSNIRGMQASDVTVIINEFKPYTDYNIYYMAYPAWLSRIMIDIEANKKLVIPMASNSKARDLLTKINGDFPEKKTLLISKETSDEEKLEKLMKVNEIWNTYDIVIYTPSVCMGVSFDVPDHFDNIYAYGCTNSLGAQEFCQMLHRVRKPRNNNIYLSMDSYKEYDNEDITTYAVVERMLCSNYYLTTYELHNNLLPKKIAKHVTKYSADLDEGIDINLVDINENVMIYPYKDEAMYDLYVRNSLEVIDNRQNFSAQFFGYAKNKGYQLTYVPTDQESVGTIMQDMKNIRMEREEEATTTTVQSILEAPDLTKEEFLNKIKQKDEYITEEDIAAIRRYNMVSCYKLDKVENESPKDILTKDFIEMYYDKDKMKWYRNLTTIIGTENQTTDDKLVILKENSAHNNFVTNCYLDFTTKNKYTYHYYACEILKSIGLSINDIPRTINQLQLELYIEETMKWCEKNKLDIAHKFDMLKTINKDLTKIEKLTDKLRYINTIIHSQYGMRVKKLKNSTNPEKTQYGLYDDNIWEHIRHLQPITLMSKLAVQEQRNYANDLDDMIDV